MRLLEGDVAIVTGAAGGIGRALAIGLAEHGAAVAALDIDAEGAAETARRAGGPSIGLGCDVSASGSATAEVAEVAARLGPVSVLVNNAGVNLAGGFDAEDFEERWRRTLDTNLSGAMRMSRACLRNLTATGGRIVNIASIRSVAGFPGGVAYGASKGGLLQLTRTLAVDLAPMGIRVNAVAPGMVATEMTARTRATPEKLASFLTRVPMGRVAEPEELVGPVVFLASSMSSYVTGAMLAVDGGYLAG